MKVACNKVIPCLEIGLYSPTWSGWRILFFTHSNLRFCSKINHSLMKYNHGQCSWDTYNKYIFTKIFQVSSLFLKDTDLTASSILASDLYLTPAWSFVQASFCGFLYNNNVSNLKGLYTCYWIVYASCLCYWTVCVIFACCKGQLHLNGFLCSCISVKNKLGYYVFIHHQNNNHLTFFPQIFL